MLNYFPVLLVVTFVENCSFIAGKLRVANLRFLSRGQLDGLEQVGQVYSFFRSTVQLFPVKLFSISFCVFIV